jgi:hypothetical protein
MQIDPQPLQLHAAASPHNQAQISFLLTSAVQEACALHILTLGASTVRKACSSAWAAQAWPSTLVDTISSAYLSPTL